MNRELRDYLLAIAIGLVGALILAHWAACEQHESFCSLTN